MTRVVSLSVRRSRCDEARTLLKRSVPEPVFAEIGMMATEFAVSPQSDINPDVKPLLLIRETI